MDLLTFFSVSFLSPSNCVPNSKAYVKNLKVNNSSVWLLWFLSVFFCSSSIREQKLLWKYVCVCVSALWEQAELTEAVKVNVCVCVSGRGCHSSLPPSLSLPLSIGPSLFLCVCFPLHPFPSPLYGCVYCSSHPLLPLPIPPAWPCLLPLYLSLHLQPSWI